MGRGRSGPQPHRALSISFLISASKPESDEIVEAVKKNNGGVEYIVFDDEGHGFTKKANEIRAYKAILDFLDKHLKGAGAVAAGN